MAAAAGVDFHIEVRAGHAAELITRYAREVEADLVVVAHRGHVLNDYLLGSTADRVAHHAHCPVMIVKWAPAEHAVPGCIRARRFRVSIPVEPRGKAREPPVRWIR